MTARIKTTGLTKNYNGFRALDDLELTVGSGRVVGFLGPNGAGKTTTLKLLSGLIFPTGGEANWLFLPPIVGLCIIEFLAQMVRPAEAVYFVRSSGSNGVANCEQVSSVTWRRKAAAD